MPDAEATAAGRPDRVLPPAVVEKAIEICGSPVRSAEVVWDRPHVVRLTLDGDRSVILKRPRQPSDDHEPNPALALEDFRCELDHLQHLQRAPDRIVPRLIGSSDEPAFLVMEDLPPGRSLASSLLGSDAARAASDLEAFAATMGRLHAWSLGCTGPERPWGVAERASEGAHALAAAADALGVGVPAAFEPAAQQLVASVVDGGPWRGFVHNDACPDNTLVTDDRFVLFDFERSGTASVLLDAAYLVAPFPTCWCWAPLPAEVVERVLAAYREAVDPEGVLPFDEGLASALGAWFLGWSSAIERSLQDDRDWGTDGLRPRLLRWGSAFVVCSRLARVWEEVADVVDGLVDVLGARWGADPPAYPAFAGSEDRVVQPPAWFAAT